MVRTEAGTARTTPGSGITAVHVAREETERTKSRTTVEKKIDRHIEILTRSDAAKRKNMKIVYVFYSPAL